MRVLRAFFVVLLPGLLGVATTPIAGAQQAAAPAFDPDAGVGVRWSAELGSVAYGGPVNTGDLVLVGTNNARPRDGGREGDLGVLMAFDLEDGRFRWQVTHDKHPGGMATDWPLQGVCSTPSVDGERIYYVSNRGELVSLDLAGERQWSLDMPARLGVVPRHMSASTPLVVGSRLFVHTSNGRAEDGSVPAPEAPSFLAVDATTGEPIWSSALPGDRIVDGQWSSPSHAVVEGREQVLFPGGDGWLYAFAPESGELLWRFDGNSALPEDAAPEQRHGFVARGVYHRERVYIPVGRDPEGPSAPGRLWVIDAAGRGDRTADGVVWSFVHEDLGRAVATVAIADGVVYLADLHGFLFALDAETGELLWRYDALAPIWTTPLVVDGRVWLADVDGDVAVLAAGRELRVLAEVTMPAPVHASPTATPELVLLSTDRRLWAIER